MSRVLRADPGDLLLDPTSGSGATACVAGQWGRRWLTIDTPRVALALARARVMGAREAGDARFDLLGACAFSYDAHLSEFNELDRIPVLKARMNADLHMANDLKNTGKGNLFRHMAPLDDEGALNAIVAFGG